MRLGNLDLNLLVALDALLAEKNVTAAAHRTGRSQPALSTSLARLRRHFGDDLLVRVGNHYELSALAEQIRPPLAVALGGAERVFASVSGFEPAAAVRRFTVMSSDYGATIVGPVLHRHLAAAGDHLTLELVPLTPEALDDLPEVLREVDVVLLPHGILNATAHLDLLHDEWVVVVDPARTALGPAPGLPELASLAWVVTEASPAGAQAAGESTPAVRQMELLGVRPQVAVSTQSFVTSLALVSGSDRATMVQRRLVESLGPPGLRAVPLPFDPVPLVEAAWWHQVHVADAGHRWLRGLLVGVAAEMQGGGPDDEGQTGAGGMGGPPSAVQPR